MDRDENGKGINMNEETRAELLKDEYVMLQQFYEEIDGKGLNIKNWAITVALAAIGAGLIYNKYLLLIAFFSSIAFWYLEAHWRGLSHFFSVRILRIEEIFRTDQWKKENPLQVYTTWEKEFESKKDQTLEYIIKPSVIIPHVLIALVSIILFYIN